MCAEFNAVRARGMWPRSLLAPFSDNVDLTVGDQRAYISYAKTELHKSFETIDVSFDLPTGPDGGEDLPPRHQPSSPPSGQPQLE